LPIEGGNLRQFYLTSYGDLNHVTLTEIQRARLRWKRCANPCAGVGSSRFQSQVFNAGVIVADDSCAGTPFPSS
jgi:hypothetical protein